jgi:preprotein translocase subunit YajC
MQLNCFLIAASPTSGLVQLLPFVLIFGVFYLLLIVPQQRQRRKTQDMLANLKSGDRVVTSGGIYGTIIGFRENVVQLQVATQVRIDVSRSAITGLQPNESEADASKKKS